MDKSGRSISSDQGRSSSGSRFFLVLVLLAVLAGISAWFWLSGHSDVKEELAVQMKELENSAINLASDMYDKLGGKTPAPEVGTTAGNSLPGAPPHYEDPNERFDELEKAMSEGSVLEGGASVRAPLNKTESEISDDSGRKDDSVVRIAFIDDLAGWLRQGYSPSGRSGLLTVNLQEANLRYGVGMRGLAWIGKDLPSGRTAALAHVYTPDMLSSLYNLYIDRFMEAVARSLADAAGKQPLTPEQERNFYVLYARQFRGISGSLQGIASLPGFAAQMDDLQRSSQNVISANAHYSELVFARDAAQEQGQTAQVSELQIQIAEAGKIYQQAVISREQSRDALALSIRRNGGVQGLDNDTILYIASWVDRRTRNHPEKMNATRQAAGLFLDLAQRFDSAGQAVLKTEAE